MADTDQWSDNSIENDFFFESGSGGGGSVGSKKSRASPGCKARARLEDLFGIKEESEMELSPQTAPNRASRSMPRISRQKPSQSNDDDDDDDDLGFDPKKPKSGSSKFNLLDDLLAPMEQKRSTTTAVSSISRQSTDTTTDNSNIFTSQPRPKTSIGRRSSGNSSAAQTDLLTLFMSTVVSSKERESGRSTPKSKKQANTADWLGLNALEAGEIPKKTEEPIEPKSLRSEVQPSEEELKNSADDKLAKDSQPTEATIALSTMQPEPERGQLEAAGTGTETETEISRDILNLNKLSLETKNVVVALNQQETHLELATQMRNHERALLEMQRKQSVLLQQQERQFQGLFQQQLQRQQQMEEHIKAQQQRINAHLQLMMSQPPAEFLAPERPESPAKSRPGSGKTGLLDMVQIEADVKRLELEKLRLEELLESMKSNYEREIEMIEASYKKQLNVAEDHFRAVEARYKAEQTELHAHYGTKLEQLLEEKKREKSDLEAQLQAARQDNEDEMRKMKKSYEDNLQLLKEEHRLMLESIRQAKMLEFATIQENAAGSGSGSFLSMLKIASSNLENLSGDLEGLREDMQTKIETLHREREKKLEQREKRLEDTERRLQITEEAAEAEKRRLMDLVTSLELQLSKLTKETDEENWLIRQKLSSLEAEKAAFERERKFMREQLERDEQRVADLKETQLLEGQKIMTELQEERTKILVLRSQMETERKLQKNTIPEHQQQLEVEAALKVAQDAARQADEERERFYKKQRQLEQEKRELANQKSNFQAREEELEHQLNVSLVAERRFKQAEQLAEQTQQDFQMKVRLLQQRLVQLGEKEAQLSQERLLLTQERIALHSDRNKMSERSCVLCKLSAQNREIAQLFTKDGTSAARTTIEDAVPLNNPLGAPQFYSMLGKSNIVERLLDESIADSLAKMKSSVNEPQLSGLWNDIVLDDDSKKRALNHFDKDSS